MKTEAIIRKEGNKWVLYSHKGKRLGVFDSREAALKRERQINFFKHQKGSVGHVAEFLAIYGIDFEPDYFSNQSIKEWISEARSNMMEDEKIARRMMDMSPEEHEKLEKELGPQKHARLMRLMRKMMKETAGLISQAEATTVQTVIVSKKCAKTRQEAIKKAKGFGPVRTMRETAESYRFRQKPPEDFDQESFRTKAINDCVTIIVGKLRGAK